MLGGFAVLSIAPGRAAATPEALCATDTPGWSIIGDASSSSAGEQFLCNYRVLRDKVHLSNGTDVNLGRSGVAITIEYYCTPEKARERYSGVAGPGNTETYRDDKAGQLIIEEGPQAKNKDNPQSAGVFSNFFTDGQGVPIPFGMMEKQWRLLNPQVFATIVVLTNERGKVDETERFGVEQGELVARTLADRSRSAAGCPIPPVATGTGSTATSGGGIPVEVPIGGALVMIGGYTVWRRRKGKRAPAPVAPVAANVPPQCRGLATLLDDQTQILSTLREAEVDLRQDLERAEKIHSNNIIKAKMVVNLEIISAIGGSATDLALALRPAALRRAGPSVLGQQDTWKPPGSISARWAEQIRNAQTAASALWSKVHAVGNDIEMMLGRVAQKVDDLPTVKNARQMLEFHMNRLGEMFTDLPKANQLRSQLIQLDHQSELLSAERAAFSQRMTPVQARLSDLQTRLNNAKNVIAAEHGLIPQDLKAAEDILADLHARGVEDTNLLGKAQDTVDRFRGQLQRASSGADVQKAMAEAKQLEATIAHETDTVLNPLLREEATLGNKSADLVGQRQKTFNELHTGLNNLTSADLDQQGRIAGQAQRELDTAIAEGHERVGQELTQRRAEQRGLEVDAASAQGQLDDLRAQAEQDTLRHAAQPPTAGGIVSAIGQAIWWASAPIRYPLTIAGELVFGVGQSPQEIMQILLQGRANVQLLRSHLGAVTRAAYDQQRKVQTARQRLDDCIKGVPIKNIDVPADNAARAA